MAQNIPPLQAKLLDANGRLTDPWMRYFQSIGIIQGQGSTPLLSNATPLTNGIASSGSLLEASRADHIHPTDTSRASQVDLDVLQEQLDSLTEYSNATGPVIAPLYNDNGNGTFFLGNGTYSLYDNASFNGNTREYEIVGRSFEPADGVTTYVIAKYLSSGAILTATTNVEDINESDVCPVITVFRDGNTLYKLHWDSIGAGKVDKLHQAEVKTNRFRLESGLKISTTGINAGYGITEGRIWYGAAKQNVPVFDSTADTTYLVYYNGTDWIKTLDTGYNINWYNNDGTLTQVSNNKYAVSFLYRSISDHKTCFIIPANGDYKLIEADKSQPPLFWELPEFIKSHSILIGRIISLVGISIPISITSAFDAQFTGSALGIHNELSLRDAIDCHPAASITNTPAGNITSINVQEALNELDGLKANKIDSVTLGATFVTNQPFKLVNDVAMPVTSIDIDAPFIDGIILSSGSIGDIRHAARIKGFEYNTILGLPSGPVLYLSKNGVLTDVVPTISAADKWSYVIARNTDNIDSKRFIIETTKPILLS